MKKVLLALALLCFNPLAHAMLVTGGVLYEDGSTFDFTWDDSRLNEYGQPSWLITFTHDDFQFSRFCCGSFVMIESPLDEGDIFGDSRYDTWSFSGIDITQDDYFFTPNDFFHAGGNHDGWHPGNNGYRANAVRSYMNVLVPEPGSLSLLLIGAVGLLVRRKSRSFETPRNELN
jgi:hypothetical protein